MTKSSPSIGRLLSKCQIDGEYFFNFLAFLENMSFNMLITILSLDFLFFPIITYLSTARTFLKEQTSHLWPSRPERKVLLNEKKWQHLSPHSLFSFLIRNVFFSIVFCWQGYYRSALKKTERLRNNTVYVITRFEHSSTQ